MQAVSYDLYILARTLYGEARGEYKRPPAGILPAIPSVYTEGLVAVGNVVMNRLQQHTWYGRSVADVCLKPYQFSCWNRADPNRAQLLRVDAATSVFRVCLDVASALINLMCPDLTFGSDHYFATSLSTPPAWVAFADEKIKIGRHRFFKMRPRR